MPIQVVQNVYGYGGEDNTSVMTGTSVTVRCGTPMDVDSMGYARQATFPFQVNLQFDGHPTEGGERFLGVRGISSTITTWAVTDARS